MWVKSFDSVWQKSDTNFHDIMSQCPGEEWIVMQEFEKWYSLYEKVIRHAKVIVGSWVEL
jgi:molecular chaperone GrpE (heat shock protein)